MQQLYYRLQVFARKQTVQRLGYWSCTFQCAGRQKGLALTTAAFEQYRDVPIRCSLHLVQQ
jgi:hypothetical protein